MTTTTYIDITTLSSQQSFRTSYYLNCQQFAFAKMEQLS